MPAVSGLRGAAALKYLLRFEQRCSYLMALKK